MNSIVSNSYYGIFRGQISMYLPPEHPIIAIWNSRIQNGRRIAEKVHFADRKRAGSGEEIAVHARGVAVIDKSKKACYKNLIKEHF